jgi:hypothetical protein
MRFAAKFHQPEGDHLTLLTVFNAWKASKFSYVFFFPPVIVWCRKLKAAVETPGATKTLFKRGTCVEPKTSASSC